MPSKLNGSHLAAKRTHKRQELLNATERDLTRIQATVARKWNPLRRVTEIALAGGALTEKTGWTAPTASMCQSAGC